VYEYPYSNIYWYFSKKDIKEISIHIDNKDKDVRNNSLNLIAEVYKDYKEHLYELIKGISSAGVDMLKMRISQLG